MRVFTNLGGMPNYAERVGAMIAHDPSCAFAFSVLRKYPRSDVFVAGGAARDAILGYVPRSHHFLVTGVDDKDLRRVCREHNTEHDMALLSDGDIFRNLGRRDFTQNAIAYSLRHGNILDPFGGIDDIEHARLRTVGAPLLSFEHDPLRIARALRFAAEHELTIDDPTWRAIRARAPRLNRTVTLEDGRAAYAVPRDAIGREFVRSFGHHPTFALDLWHRSGALEAALPELFVNHIPVDERGEPALARARRLFETLTESAFLRIHGMRRPSATLVLAALASVFGNHAFDALLSRLHVHKVRNETRTPFDYESLCFLRDHHNDLRETDPSSLRPHAFVRVFGGDRGRDLLALIHAHDLAQDENSLVRERIHAVRRLRSSFSREHDGALVRGRDLESLDLTPGPVFRAILTHIRDAELVGDVNSKDEALELARSLVREMTT